MVHRGFHVGTFLLFTGTVLLIVSSIGAPIFGDLTFLHLELTNKTTIRNSSVNFGVFGLCVLDVPPDSTDQDYCSGRSVGYDISGEIAALGIPPFGSTKASALNGLTKGLVLHPVAAGIAFLAFLLAVSSHRFGYLVASGIAFIAWIFTLVCMAIDFSLFGAIKSHVNRNSDIVATYGLLTWLTLTAFVILFFATPVVCAACITARQRRK